MKDRKFVMFMIGKVVKSSGEVEFYIFEGVTRYSYKDFVIELSGELSVDRLWKRWSLYKGFNRFEDALEKLIERITLNNDGKGVNNAKISAGNAAGHRARRKAREHKPVNKRIRRPYVMRRIQQPDTGSDRRVMAENEDSR